MVHLTLAIADFMGILIAAALWAAASVGGAVLLALATMAAALWGVRKLWRRLAARR